MTDQGNLDNTAGAQAPAPSSAHTPASAYAGSTGPYGPARPRMATWKIVALTLAGVFGALLLFVGGFVTGVATSKVAGGAVGGSGGGVDSGSEPGTGSASAATGDGNQSGASGAVPACLVGTWRTTAYEQRATTPQGETVLTNLISTFTYDKNGGLVVKYANAESTMAVGGQNTQMTFNGTVTYRIAVTGSTMSFSLVSVDGNIMVKGPDGSSKEQELKPGTGDVTFSCSGDTYEESSEGYSMTAKRVG